jgi:hypothetical protein
MSFLLERLCHTYPAWHRRSHRSQDRRVPFHRKVKVLLELLPVAFRVVPMHVTLKEEPLLIPYSREVNVKDVDVSANLAEFPVAHMCFFSASITRLYSVGLRSFLRLGLTVLWSVMSVIVNDNLFMRGARYSIAELIMSKESGSM